MSQHRHKGAEYTLSLSVPLTIQFPEEASHLKKISGGKGSSLGKLTQLSQKEKKHSLFQKGVVVTTSAYNEFLSMEICDAVKHLEDVAYGNEAGDLKETCKRNGQVLNSPMAVVIQDMVDCKVSGVLFTCDPITHNPSVITITANYGLGESGGTATEDVDDNLRNEYCLKIQTVERLGKIAFECRPVTKTAAKTDHEIKHEFDAPLRCENEYFTVANIGEILPGATSTLGIDLVMKYYSVYFRDLFFYDLGFEKVKKKINNYSLDFLKLKSAEETFTALINSCSDFDEDISCQIVKDLGSERFRCFSVEEAEYWLQTTKTISGHHFREFLKRHGHRCLKEFDVRSVTWGMNSKLLVKLLQNLAVSTKKEIKKESDSIDKIFSQLRISLNFTSRFILPLCRKAVRVREAGKSLTIKSFDHWRKGYRRLGKLMVSEGRLPDQDLIFFF
ncbi:putative phosphoenolpyruvate synthase [Caerostris extrusa]|uniref:Phosphoenolpyruvate synthase n=1 Tax=Caerostris extrusa TaxID=172846 RepID=A0AAV4URC7_CAEEX|nr:putative phosphoenolpyruvate synthase [Caerostris extrusa]